MHVCLDLTAQAVRHVRLADSLLPTHCATSVWLRSWWWRYFWKYCWGKLRTLCAVSAVESRASQWRRTHWNAVLPSQPVGFVTTAWRPGGRSYASKCCLKVANVPEPPLVS